MSGLGVGKSRIPVICVLDLTRMKMFCPCATIRRTELWYLVPRDN